MPEGDTIFRAARSLHRVLAGHAVTRFETAYAHLDRVNVDTPIVGRTIERCESAGKHLLIVVQRRPDPAHAHAHERLVASLSPRRALVARRAGDARAHRHRGLGRGRVQRAGRRVRDGEAAGDDAIRWRSSGPDLLGATFDRDEAIRRIVASGASRDRADAARSAHRRRHRQHLQVRSAVHVGRASGHAVERRAARRRSSA